MFYIKWAGSTIFGLMHQEKYSGAWDRTLKALIKLHGDTATLDGHTLRLGDHEIWIANEYYSYGHLYDWNSDVECRHRPSVRTMGKLDKIVNRIRDAQYAAKEKEAFDRYRNINV